jgi:hypothetical protein
MMGECGSDSPTTTEGHRLFATTRCCNYSLFELLMMGEYGSDSPTTTEGHRLPLPDAVATVYLSS